MKNLFLVVATILFSTSSFAGSLIIDCKMKDVGYTLEVLNENNSYIGVVSDETAIVTRGYLDSVETYPVDVNDSTFQLAAEVADVTLEGDQTVKIYVFSSDGSWGVTVAILEFLDADQKHLGKAGFVFGTDEFFNRCY